LPARPSAARICVCCREENERRELRVSSVCVCIHVYLPARYRVSPLRTHHCYCYRSNTCSAIPLSHCASIYNTTSDFDSPTSIQPNNPAIATTCYYCYLQAIAIATTPPNNSQQESLHHSDINLHDHINPRHRLTIPKHHPYYQQHRNNEEIPPHSLNHHPTLDQPPTLLQLHLNRHHPTFPLALQPPLSQHRRPQHPLSSRLPRSISSPLNRHA